MSFFKNYRTPFGYVADGNHVDAYGVDHSGFSTRDEVQYQFARQEREKQMADNLTQQGIEPENYPQLGTAFWGNSDNNYGFGSSNIHDNIENRNNNPFENTVNTFGQSQTGQSYGLENNNQNQNLSWPQSYGLGSENQTFGQENNNSTQWGLNNTPLAQNNNNNTLSGNLFGNNNLFNQTQSVWNKNQYQTQTPWAKQSTSLGRNQPVPNKPVYENPNPKGYSAGNIAWSALEGFGEGIENGLLYATNAITHGGFDLLNDVYFNNAYEKKLNAFEDRLNRENIPAVNKAYKYAKYFIDNTAGNIPIVPFVKKAK